MGSLKNSFGDMSPLIKYYYKNNRYKRYWLRTDCGSYIFFIFIIFLTRFGPNNHNDEFKWLKHTSKIKPRVILQNTIKLKLLTVHAQVHIGTNGRQNSFEDLMKWIGGGRKYINGVYDCPPLKYNCFSHVTDSDDNDFDIPGFQEVQFIYDFILVVSFAVCNKNDHVLNIVGVTNNVHLVKLREIIERVDKMMKNMVHGTCLHGGTWYMVHGTWYMPTWWYMVHGAWYMVHGTWYMVHGTWYMVHGTWYMVHAAWYILHGTCCILHDINMFETIITFLLAWTSAFPVNRCKPLGGRIFSILSLTLILLTSLTKSMIVRAPSLNCMTPVRNLVSCLNMRKIA